MKKTTKKPTIPRTKKRNTGPPRKNIEHAKFVLRISPQLHAKVKKHAEKNFQSMNECIARALAEMVDPKNNLIKRLEAKGVI